jgi:predicted nucleic acid-binding protein
VAGSWDQAADGGLLVACPVVALELAQSARDSDGVARVGEVLAALPEAPVNRAVTDSAFAALGELAGTGGGRHRLPIADALIAAAAAERGFDVLHYDHHYDILATVLDFGSRWITPPGSLV